MNTLISPDLTSTSLIVQFRLGPTKIQKPKPEDIETLCVVDSPNSFRAEVMSFRLLTLQKESITPVHAHPNKEKSYLRFRDPAIIADVKVFLYRNGIWSVFFINNDGRPVIIPARTPHAVYTTARVEIMVITSNQDPQTEWGTNKPTATT